MMTIRYRERKMFAHSKGRSRLILAVCLSSIALAVPAVAQQSSEETRAILDAVRGLGTRLDGMQKDIDALKGARTAPAAPAPAAQSPAPAAAQPARQSSGQLRPGWVVSAFIKGDNANGNFDSDPVGIFVQPNSRFNSEIHRKHFAAANRLSYRADAFIRIEEAGRYVFVGRAESDRSMTGNCQIWLSIDDKEVFKSGYGNWNNGTARQGGIDLASGDFKIAYYQVCDTGESAFSNFVLQIRGPGELTPRDFTAREIVHIARAERRSSAEPRAATSAEAVPASGAQRRITSEVNVRQGPAVTASVATKLQPGQQIVVAGITDDRQWAIIDMNGRRIGYIRVSALNQNSQ
jgi:hypothetical protein